MRNIRVGINGAGRIGRLVIRLLTDHPEIEISCINDPMAIDTLKYLLTYDSVHQQFHGNIDTDKNNLYLNGVKVPYHQFKNPKEIPWKKYRTDIVIEASGLFLTEQTLMPHIHSGAQRVILSCPAKDDKVKTVIVGINDHFINSHDIILSNASCTANGIAPMLQVMNDNFEIESAFLTTVHPFTNNQRIMDAPHPDPRRSRSLYGNIIPTHSTAVEAIIKVFPFLKDKFDGIAIRVPVPAGAFLELTVRTKKKVSNEAINEAFLDASLSYLKHILAYTEDELVSSDVINNPASCIFDSKLTKIVNENFCYLAGWYDNEFGYAKRVVNLIEKSSEHLKKSFKY